MKIYVASSWKNGIQPLVVNALRADHHIVYDFKDEEGFHWSMVDPEYKTRAWSPRDWAESLSHPLAEKGFARDMTSLMNADACIMVTPCGMSASLELGYAVGAEKHTAILIPDNTQQPELMFKMADVVVTGISALVRWANNPQGWAQ